MSGPRRRWRCSARIPETEPRPARSPPRHRTNGEAPADDFDDKLAALLDKVKDDEDARQEYVDILEVMGPTTPARRIPPPAHQPPVLILFVPSCDPLRGD